MKMLRKFHAATSLSSLPLLNESYTATGREGTRYPINAQATSTLKGSLTARYGKAYGNWPARSVSNFRFGLVVP